MVTQTWFRCIRCSLLSNLHLFQLRFQRAVELPFIWPWLSKSTVHSGGWPLDSLWLMETDWHLQKPVHSVLTNFGARTQPKIKTGAFWHKHLPPGSVPVPLVKGELVKVVGGVQSTLAHLERDIYIWEIKIQFVLHCSCLDLPSLLQDRQIAYRHCIAGDWIQARWIPSQMSSSVPAKAKWEASPFVSKALPYLSGQKQKVGSTLFWRQEKDLHQGWMCNNSSKRGRWGAQAVLSEAATQRWWVTDTQNNKGGDRGIVSWWFFSECSTPA